MHGSRGSMFWACPSVMPGLYVSLLNVFTCNKVRILICGHTILMLCRCPEVAGDDKDPWTEIITKLERMLKIVDYV